MASPQVEDGYTRIANELLEAIYGGPFNRREIALILAIIRATYGWGQKTTTLGKLELIRRAKINPSDGYKTFRDLENRQVITRKARGMGIQKDYELWHPCPRGELPLEEISPRGNLTYYKGKSPLVDQVKSLLLKSRERPSDAASRLPKESIKEITKENIADAPPASAPGDKKKGPKIHPETDSCIRLFSEQFSKKFEERTYQIEHGRDRKLISGLLRGHGPQVVIEQIRNFFRCPPLWVKEKGRYDIPAFRSAFNQLQVLKGRGDI